MTLTRLVLPLLLLLPALPACGELQDAGNDRLTAATRDLDSGDPRRVFAAVQTIAQLGGASLPAIDARAKEAKGRVRDYLELAAEEIRLAPHLPGFPPVKRLSMKSTDKNVVELLSDLRARTGAAIALDNLLDEEKLPEIAFEVKDATMLEAFDAICHAGNVTVSMENSQFMLYTGTYVDLPRFFYGHYYFRLSEYDHLKTVNFRRPAVETFDVHMEMIWDPAAAPLRYQPVRVVEALDDRGRSLVRPEPKPRDPNAAKPEDEPDFETLGPAMTLHLLPPSPAAQKIAVLRGFCPIVLPKARTTLTFETAESRKGDARNDAAAPVPPEPKSAVLAGDFKAVVTRIDLANHSVVLEISAKKLKTEALGELDLLSHVVLKGWESTSSYVTKSSPEDDVMEITVSYEPLRFKDSLVRPTEETPPPTVEKLEVSVVTSTQEKRIPFEFRDLKIR
jgi:hypothetical protein